MEAKKADQIQASVYITKIPLCNFDYVRFKFLIKVLTKNNERKIKNKRTVHFLIFIYQLFLNVDPAIAENSRGLISRDCSSKFDIIHH